jgi:hypothetical protein
MDCKFYYGKIRLKIRIAQKILVACMVNFNKIFETTYWVQRKVRLWLHVHLE